MPVVVARNTCLADTRIDSALAVGRGLHERQGWQPALRLQNDSRPNGGLEDLDAWWRLSQRAAQSEPRSVSTPTEGNQRRCRLVLRFESAVTMFEPARKFLFGSGVLGLALSFVLDPSFATDQVNTVPEPGTFSLLAIVGAGVIAVSLIGRRKKK